MDWKKVLLRAGPTAILLFAAPMLGGCTGFIRAVTAIWMTSTPYDVPPEYDLAPAAKKGHALVIRVWVDPAIEGTPEGERASLDVGRAVAAAFASKEDPNPLRGLELVRPESVRRYLDSRRGGDFVSARSLSEFFNAPLVLEIELTEYSSRAKGSRDLFQGRVTGVLSLYDFTDEGADADDNRLPPKSREVHHEFPEEPQQERSGASELAIWLQLRAGFGKKVADKFRLHEKMYDPKENFRSAD